MRILRSRSWLAVLVTLGVVAVCVGLVYWNWPANRRADEPEFRAIAYADHGMDPGGIRPGDSVEPLLSAHPSWSVYRHDEFVTAGSDTPDETGIAMSVIAKNGRVVVVRGNVIIESFFRVAFNTLTPTEWREYEASFSVVMDCEREKLFAPRHAVGGAAGVAFNNHCLSRFEFVDFGTGR